MQALNFISQLQLRGYAHWYDNVRHEVLLKGTHTTPSLDIYRNKKGNAGSHEKFIKRMVHKPEGAPLVSYKTKILDS